MTQQQHPITPPPELVEQWIGAKLNWIDRLELAYQAGADAELRGDQMGT